MAGIMLKGEVYYYSCCCFVESKSFATPIDCSTPCSSVHGDFPGKNTGVVAIPFSRGSSQPRDQTRISCLTSGFFTTEATQQQCSSLGFPDSSVGKESACNAGDPGLIPGLGRSTGEGIGYPLQYSWASLVAQLVNNLLAMWETWV